MKPDDNLTTRTPESARHTSSARATEFTPGPWSVKPDSIVSRPFRVEGDGWTVASVHYESHRDGDTEANAHLIAAAPDLLAACEEALHFMLTRLGVPQREVEIVRAAIAKAQGGDK